MTRQRGIQQFTSAPACGAEETLSEKVDRQHLGIGEKERRQPGLIEGT